MFSQAWPLSADAWEDQMLFLAAHRLPLYLSRPAWSWPLESAVERQRDRCGQDAGLPGRTARLVLDAQGQGDADLLAFFGVRSTPWVVWDFNSLLRAGTQWLHESWFTAHRGWSTSSSMSRAIVDDLSSRPAAGKIDGKGHAAEQLGPKPSTLRS